MQICAAFLFVSIADSLVQSIQPRVMPSMRCTLVTALLVPQSSAFAPSIAAVTPSSASRGTAKLHAAPYERYLDAACEAARAAGALIRSASTDERAVDTLKANAKDLLTKTDVACQDVAAAVLARREPTSRLLGEEDVAPGADAARRAAEKAFAADGLVWAVDPIDGTANFVDAIPLSATSVAAVECVSGKCRVVAGAVYDPYRDELFGAAYGKGAWVEAGGKRTPLAVSASTLGDAIVYAGAPPGMRALKPSRKSPGTPANFARNCHECTVSGWAVCAFPAVAVCGLG